MADSGPAATRAMGAVGGTIPLPEVELPPDQKNRNRRLAILFMVLAAALLGYAGCRVQSDDERPPEIDPAPDVGQLAGPELFGEIGTGRVIHVSAQAAEGGDGGATTPLTSLQSAIRMAGPGETVLVGPGTYAGPFKTERAGAPEQPIRIVGDKAKIIEPRAGGKDGKKGGSGHVFTIGHDHVVLTGFDISGGDTSLWVFNADHVRIARNYIHHARRECVRVKFFSSNNEIAHNRVQRCGLEGFDVSEQEKNGEGIYIGTAPEQRERNPNRDPDQSNDNNVHDNYLVVHAECVDVKEGARGNVVRNNVCQGGKDPDSAGFSSRGIATTFEGNTSKDHAGGGIRLGGDSVSDGLGSIVRGNRLIDNKGYGLKINEKTDPRAQQAICENIVEGNSDGESNSAGLDPSRPC